MQQLPTVVLSMKFRLIPALVIGITLSIVTSEIVYFGYTPKYGPIIFSRNAFESMFDHDVFKYRLLSQHLLFGLDDWLVEHIFSSKNRKPVLNPNKNNHFYVALYYLNTFSLCLTTIIVVLLLRLKRAFILTDSERYLFLYLTILIINFSQFVVSPYDVSSYFFQLLIFYLFLSFSDKDFYFTIGCISALIFISTLNRESSALSISLASILLYKKLGISQKTILSTLILLAFFAVTYVGLRYIVVDPQSVHFTYKDAGNLLANINIIGLLFWAIFFCLSLGISGSTENRKAIFVYHLLSLPYIIVCFRNGVLWEVRLYVPLLLSSLFISKLNPAVYKFNLDNLLKINPFTKNFKETFQKKSIINQPK